MSQLELLIQKFGLSYNIQRYCLFQPLNFLLLLWLNNQLLSIPSKNMCVYVSVGLSLSAGIYTQFCCLNMFILIMFAQVEVRHSALTGLDVTSLLCDNDIDSKVVYAD